MGYSDLIINGNPKLEQVMAWCHQLMLHPMLAKICGTLWRQSATIISGLGVAWGHVRCPQPEIQISHAIPYLTDEKSTLDQVMAWCHQAPSHYLIQCWSESMVPYDVSKPHWVHHAWWSSKDNVLSRKSNSTGHPLYHYYLIAEKSKSAQAITWFNVDPDLWHHITSCHNKLNPSYLRI